MTYLADADLALYHGDCLEVLAGMDAGSADCVVTSPPYLEARPEYPSPTLHEFEAIFRELGRVVNGPALVNVGRLWRGGIEQMWWIDLLRSCERAGWRLLDTLIWVKPNANPIQGAVLASSHEYVLILGQPGDEFNTDAVRTEYDPESLARFMRRYRNGTGVKGEERPRDGREANERGARPRSFFIAYVGKEKGNDHPAPMAYALAEHLVRLASFPGQIVLDPFAGSGTTLLAARRLGRSSVGIERDFDYCRMAAERLSQLALALPMGSDG